MFLLIFVRNICPVEYITSSERPFGELQPSQVVQDAGFAAAPGTHEEHQRLGEYFRIAKMSITQISVLIKYFQGFDGVFVQSFQISEYDVSGFFNS